MQFERLAKHHDRQTFDCGNAEINHYLQTMANQHSKKDIAKVHILTIDEHSPNIIGFYTLSNIYLDNDDLMIKGLPRKIPAILIGRMGVDLAYQGQGLSKLLLSHALKKIKNLSLDTGICFVVIDAKDESLAKFYEKFGFISTDTPLRLILSVKAI